MFHSATLKLTALYLGILAVICLFFSVSLYRVSVREVGNDLNRQAVYFRQLPYFPGQLFSDPDFDAQRQEQLSQSRQNIILGLIETDLIILGLGGIGSYYLARRTLRPMEEAHDAQRRFTADASHELRTPIAAMQTEIEVALRDPHLSKDDAVKLLGSNLEELSRLTELSAGLLKLAKQEEATEAFVPVDLSAVVDAAVETQQPAARHKKIHLELATDRSVKVLGAQASLLELIGLLVDNAIKYSPANQTVHIELTADAKTATIRVRDHGPGISPADQAHLFERFYRSDQTRANVLGHGLGLAIASQIVERHHGQISVESVLGAGATFVVRLPRS